MHSLTHSYSIYGPSNRLQAVVVYEHGDASKLTYVEDHPVPAVKDGHILVKNSFAGLNFIDTYFRKGLYKQPLPFVAGQEGGGTVVAVPSDADAGFVVGDEVAYMAMGSYCEYTVVPIGRAVKVPQGMSMEVAIAAMVQGLTGHYLAKSAVANCIERDQWCLVYSVASGTGKWAAQIAQQLCGYKVIGTCAKSKDVETARKLCDELIVLDTVPDKSYSDYTSVDIVNKVVQDITGGAGCHAIIDGVGKSTADISLQCLARRGIWISFGNASGAVPDVSPLKLVPKSAFMTRPKLNDYIATTTELQQRWTELSEWILNSTVNGGVKVDIDKVFPLKEATEGHLHIETGKTTGKVLFSL